MFTTGIRKLGIALLGASTLVLAAACGTEEESITLGFVPSWTDGLSTAYLLTHFLEEAGYTVDMEEISQPGVLYTGLSEGDIDIYPSAWPEVTHAEYMERFSDGIEELGAYYDGAVLTWAVPSYSEITSFEEIADYADVLDNRIIGIEPGAGLTAASEGALETYELDDFTLVTSSTTAMLAELQGAIADEEEIVVTLWRPFWANAEFDMVDLEDPRGAMGETEALWFLGTDGFSEEYPEVAEWISQIKLDDVQYGSLEDTVVNQFEEGQEREAIEAWLAENPDVMPELTVN